MGLGHAYGMFYVKPAKQKVGPHPAHTDGQTPTHKTGVGLPGRVVHSIRVIMILDGPRTSLYPLDLPRCGPPEWVAAGRYAHIYKIQSYSKKEERNDTRLIVADKTKQDGLGMKIVALILG